jgi:hypothetical protein
VKDWISVFADNAVIAIDAMAQKRGDDICCDGALSID